MGERRREEEGLLGTSTVNHNSKGQISFYFVESIDKSSSTFMAYIIFCSVEEGWIIDQTLISKGLFRLS